MQSLEQEINERKAEHQSSAQSTTIPPNKQSKLSNALDKLLCKRDKEQQAQQQKQIISDDVPLKNVANNLSTEDKMEAVDMETEPEIVSDERHHDSNSTNKFELEFVNNMPKPPSPKSSLIFSPPPSSLSIDKRDASIFDFADNFSIPNDSSVSLLTFNPDNIFKEDSAKETMDLVANLRQNIKKGGKHDDNNKTKTEPTVNQSQVIEIDTSPDSTTMDTNANRKVEEDNKRGIKPAIQSATLVIDLEQENSGDESKSSRSPHVQQPKPQQINENNWMPNATMNATTNNMVQPMQLQTEVEKMASKMQSSNEIIPTPADILMANEMNEQQNANTFHNQPPYVNNSYNGGMSPSRPQQQQPPILDQKQHSLPIKNDRVTIRHRRDLMGDDNPSKFPFICFTLFVQIFHFNFLILPYSVRERTFAIHAK